MVVDDSRRDFGLSDCGGESATTSVLISNASDASLSWSTALEGPFVAVGPSVGTIEGMGTATISIAAQMPAVSPSGASVAGTLVITSNDPAHAMVRIPLTAIARGAELHYQPTAFGDVPVTSSSPVTSIAIQNTGNGAVDVALGQPSRGDFIIVSGTVHLEPGATAAPTMRFSPQSAGAISGTVPLVVKGPLCGVRQDIALSGKGTKGVVLTSPGALDFGMVACGTTANPKKVTIANTGDAPFDFGAKLGNALYDVAPESSTVAPGQSTDVTITPKPIPSTSAVIPDLYAGTLTITTTAPGDLPHVVDLHQTAYGAILTTTQPALDAGSRIVDDAITVPMGTISNAGNATVSLNGTGAGGVAMAPTSIPAGGSASGAATFALDPSVHPLGVTATQTFPLAVAPVPLCAPAPLVTVTVRSIDRAIDFDSTGNEGTLCAVGHTHRAYCVGSNLWGQIKDGPPYTYEPLTLVKSVSADTVGVAAGSSCFAKGPTMTCRTIGFQNNGGPIPPPWTTTFPASVTRIRGAVQPYGPVGYNGAYLVLLANGTVYGAGEGPDGIFGVPSPPVPGPFVAMGGVSDAIDVAIGQHHACVARATGDVLCAGYGYSGEVVSGAVSQSAYLSPVSNAVGATRLALSTDRTCILRGNGTMACWGAPWMTPYQVPTPITDLPFPIATARTSIATDGLSFAALRATGGADAFSILGSSSTVLNAAPGASLRPGIVVSLPVALRHGYCSLEPGGKIACFGGLDPPGYLAGFD